MRLHRSQPWLVATIFVALCCTAAAATPTLNVGSASIATDETGSVQLTVGNLGGSRVVLRLFVDADGDGTIDPEDYVIWTDVIDDNGTPWSPAMFSDSDPAAGTVVVGVRTFTPFGLPYTAGDFIWQAEDSGDSSTATAAFSVTQAAQTQFVSGTVTDPLSAPVPGALVLLEPFCDEGEESLRSYSTFADETGAFFIAVPSELDCHHRLLLTGKPGYMTSFDAAPHLVFSGSDSFGGQSLELTPGTYAVTGQVTYGTGPRIGQGIPGLGVWAEGDEYAAVTFSDDNGDYQFLLDDGPWEIENPEDGADTRGVVGLENSLEFTVSGGPQGLSPISLPAANAFFQGTLYDEAGSPLGGQWVAAQRQWPCDPECYFTETLTQSDGTYTLGVLTPVGSSADYSLEVVDPLPGLVGSVVGCQTIDDGETLIESDLDHIAPTGFVTGVMTDKDGQGLENICVSGWAGGPGCDGYRSIAITDCDGSYSLPVVDAQWDVRADIGDFAGIYRDLDETNVSRSVTVAGADEDGVNFVIGRSRSHPTLAYTDPSEAPPGAHVAIDGFGLSDGSTPQVFFDATPATVVAFRPDVGTLIVEVPGTLLAGDYSITVVNPDSGEVSDPSCFAVTPGPYSPACSISGTATQSAVPVANAAVVVFDDGDNFARAAVTDGNGDYSVGLDAAGDYEVMILPPQGQPWSWGVAFVTCGTTLDHGFDIGSQLTGQVVDDGGDGVAGALGEVEEIGGSGYFQSFVTDQDGFFTIHVPTGTFEIFFDSPPGSRFLPPAPVQTVVSGNTDTGPITMSSGFYFCGEVLGADGSGLPAEVEAYRKSDDQWFGFADTNSCTGQFDIALPQGEYRLELLATNLAVDAPTEVKWVDVQGDELSPFAFTVVDSAAVPPAGPEPRIGVVEPEPKGTVGQTLRLVATNIDGASVSVLFSNGVGGFVAGDATVWDSSRGLVITRVPPAAATGEMKLQVDGVDSSGVSFELDADSLPPTPHSVSGTVTDDVGGPVAGVLVALLWIDPTSGECDGDGLLVDYAVTDGSGDYAVSHPGGDFQMAFFPPSGSTLAARGVEQFGIFTNMTIDISLVQGVSVHVRAVDDEVVPNPVADAQFEVEGDGPGDWRVTDANGDATLFVAPSNVDLFLIPPAGSRLIESEWTATISVPEDFGDRTMVTGVMVGSAVLREDDGSGLAGVFVEGRRDTDPWDFFFETQSSAGGLFRGPVAAGATLQIELWTSAQDLANATGSGLSVASADCILYPPVELGPAGFVEGVIRDASSSAPLADINLSANEDDGGSPGDPSGFARTCPDGSYRLKLAVGDHYLSFYDFEQNLYFNEVYPDAYCFEEATPISISAGGTVMADVDLDESGSISGVVTFEASPVQGTNVCSSSTTLGSCVFCGGNSDAGGNYSLPVPPATDHRVEAWDPGLGQQCYDGFDNCNDFTTVSVTAGNDTPGIDFEYGCSTADADADGVDECGGDCDDFDPNNFPGNVEVCDFVDNNCDTAIDEGFDLDGDGFTVCGGDCDDSNANAFPGNPEFCDGADNDCDGSVPPDEVDGDGDGHYPFGACFGPADDCDDSDPSNFPGNFESCDGLDNDCDSGVDEGLSTDNDFDGHYTPGSCFGPADDCDDFDPTNFPGNFEACDGQDNDCDSVIDDGLSTDNDGDGHYTPGSCFGPADDCDDTNPGNFPGNLEVCDGVDNNCDSVPDEGLSTDADGDGHYTPSSCFGPADDCDDFDPNNFPGNPELCDGADNNCDTVADEGLSTDADGDGHYTPSSCATPADDCDDSNPNAFPGNPEICDDVDNNCDSSIDEGLSTDADGDGHYTLSSCAAPADDCDDADPNNFPGNAEVCDSLDNNCDSLADEGLSTDADGDGHYTTGSCAGPADDCDDANPANFPGNPEVCDSADNNCDSVVDEGLSTDADGDGHYTPGSCAGPADDCDDAAPNNFPGNAEVCDGLDNNCDTVVDDGLNTDADGDGHYPQGACLGPADDCDDADPNNFPGNPELCDGADNDCNTLIDDGLSTDVDGDGHYTPGSCAGPADDCDDADPANFPGNAELCDGADNDCNTLVDDGLSTDADADGHFTPGSCATPADDCDDADPTAFPGNAEVCDAVDNDCNSLVDDGLSTDADGDGHYTPGSCAVPNDDCDDAAPSNFPGNPEVCDGADNNCDTLADEGLDMDGDGFTTCAGDCDDTEVAVFPGNPEICDGLDNDCDGTVPPTEVDADGDGHYPVGACFGPADDCDDADPAINPSVTEICDGLDNNCDLAIDEGLSTDADGDGHYTLSSCAGPADDCDDADANNFPGNSEVCDSADNNCDSVADEGLSTDADGDGHYLIGSCFAPADDCDDADANNFPGNLEVCDSADNNCDLAIDEGLSTDADGDGHYTLSSCAGPADDCDDADANNFPGNSEVCDSADNNCDSVADEGLSTDADGDGHYLVGSCFAPADDCDDADADNFPGNTEVCDGADNNCDSVVDEGLSTDADGDGHYTLSSCFAPADDCDDADASNFPGNTEVCDGSDNNCDTAVDEGLSTDADGDGHYTLSSCLSPADDCDDTDPSAFPGNAEACDGVDNDCDSVVPSNETDDDGDGQSECEGDCDDTTGSRNTEAAEVCDGVDNDCDGTADEGFDADSDTVADCIDNCIIDANQSQDDFDLDGVGDVCETGIALADIDGSSKVDGFDLARLARAFGSSCGDSAYDVEADLDRDAVACIIDGVDLALLAAQFGFSISQ